MTDQTTPLAASNPAAADAPTGAQAATAPFPEAHRRIIQELLADAHLLITKIEGTKALIEASPLLDDAKADIVSATKSIFAHFERLAAKVDGEVRPAPAAQTAPATAADAPVPAVAPASTDAPTAETAPASASAGAASAA